MRAHVFLTCSSPYWGVGGGRVREADIWVALILSEPWGPTHLCPTSTAIPLVLGLQLQDAKDPDSAPYQLSYFYTPPNHYHHPQAALGCG